MESIGTGFEGLEKLLDEHRQQQSAEELQEVAGDTPASAEDTGDVPAQQGGAGSHQSPRAEQPSLRRTQAESRHGLQQYWPAVTALNSFLQPRGPNMATLDENGGLSVAAARWKLAGKVVMTMPGSEPHDIAKMQRDEQAAAGEPVFEGDAAAALLSRGQEQGLAVWRQQRERGLIAPPRGRHPDAARRARAALLSAGDRTVRRGRHRRGRLGAYMRGDVLGPALARGDGGERFVAAQPLVRMMEVTTHPQTRPHGQCGCCACVRHAHYFGLLAACVLAVCEKHWTRK